MIHEQRGAVGVLGEAGVGKTQTVGQALGMLPGRPQIIHLDLNRAASDGHVGFLLARRIAHLLLSEKDFAVLSGGTLVTVAAELEQQRLAELLGAEFVAEAVRSWPSGRLSSSAALTGLEALLMRMDIVLWIDHFEAPALTPRHPFDCERLLQEVGELRRRAPRLRLVVSAREALRQEFAAASSAFEHERSLLTLDAPSRPVWDEVATRLGTPAASREVAQLVQLSAGHPATMLLALEQLRLAGAEQRLFPESLLRDLAIRDSGRAAGVLQQARTLHRLGEQVLRQIALGHRPYLRSHRGSASPQEIRKVLNRLHRAGLLRRTDRWALVDPLVAILLREPPSLEAPGAGEPEDRTIVKPTATR